MDILDKLDKNLKDINHHKLAKACKSIVAYDENNNICLSIDKDMMQTQDIFLNNKAIILEEIDVFKNECTKVGLCSTNFLNSIQN